jgi:biotin transport system substrate-specific component
VTGRLTARDLALVATFAALLAVLGLPGQLNLFGNAVPITAQTLGVMLAGSLLGARRGALAVLVFCVLVVLGLPLLAGGRGGLGVLTAPPAGFFIGFVPGAFVLGAIMGLWRGRFALGWAILANVVGGILVVYAFGIPIQAWISHAPLTKVAVADLLFVPGDLLKAVVAAVIARGVFRAYPQAGLGVVGDRESVGAA